MTTVATTPLFSTPYLTVQEFKNAPTAIDINDLIGGGVQAVQDAELANVVARASSWIDTYCGQVLAATADIDATRARLGRDGYLRVAPRFRPIQVVTSVAIGTTPSLLGSVDVSSVWIEDALVHIPVTAFGSTFSGSLGFSSVGTSRELFVKLGYINGYANTVFTGTVASGVSSLTLVDATGIIGGLTGLAVYDGANSETVHAASVSGNTVTLTAPTKFAHDGSTTAIAVSALPPAIKQAAISISTALLKARGSTAIVMAASNTPGKVSKDEDDLTVDIKIAKELLAPYRRIR